VRAELEFERADRSNRPTDPSPSLAPPKPVSSRVMNHGDQIQSG
jgi:hypothetical protein